MGTGPLERVVAAGTYGELHLLSTYPTNRTSEVAERLQNRTRVSVLQQLVNLAAEAEDDFAQILGVSLSAVRAAVERKPGARLTFHLSSGTAAMAAAWIILSRTRWPADLVQTTPSGEVRSADVPYDVTAEFLDGAVRIVTGQVSRPGDAALGDPGRCGPQMAETLRRAERLSMTDAPVLLEGEAGVEAEAFARLVHQRSRRAAARFVSFPCRATSREHIEAELFGQAARVFGAPFQDQPGQLELARGATVFLDEVAEIPLGGQARLSRLLSTGTATRLGGLAPTPVDVRVIAGTTRDLAVEVAEGRFLEDLYRQLSIAAVRIPSIRERKDELPELINRLLAETNDRCSAMTPKRFSPEARNELLSRDWPGNVTELRNSLTRLVVWAEHETISVDDVRQHLGIEAKTARADGILGRPFDESFRMEDVLDEVSRSYIERALEEAGGVKAKAVELLGMSNATTLTNWMKRLGLGGGAKR